MEINPNNVLAVEHQTWLAHPVTQQMIRNLEKHKQSFVDDITRNATEYARPDQSFRMAAYGMKTTDAIKNILTDTEKFVTLAERK